ncbi:MAG TPA: FHA domain-containing protein [Pseudomonadota bacterium]|nr:FHA domain-containing protein [Pseudomonadota bacterium]
MKRGLALRALCAVRVLLAWLVCAAVSQTASASKPRCRLERVDLSDFDQGHLVRVTSGVVELEGQVNTERPAQSCRLLVNGKAVAKPDKAEPFDKAGHELYLVLAVEVSALYEPSFDKIKETLNEFLDTMPPKTRVKLIKFGYELEPTPLFMPPGAVKQAIEDISPDDQGDVQLLNAIQAGLVALNKVQPGKDASGQSLPPPRKAIVVLSDGMNQLMDRKTFRRMAEVLRQSGVPLFPVAFSPRDDRGPLLNLGELAKRSFGTFRWAQKDDDLKEQFQNLAEEIKKTHVFHFSAKKLKLDALRAAQFSIQCQELKSNVLTQPGVPPEKPSTWWKWLLGIVLTLVGLWGAAQGALFVLRRKAQKMGVLGQPDAQPTLSNQVPPGAPTQLLGYPTMKGNRIIEAQLIGIGALAGQRRNVDQAMIIGRSVGGSSNWQITTDDSLGPSHCEIRREPNGYWLIDYGSPSGCFVNEHRIISRQLLNDGDLVRFGAGTQVKFRLED